MLLVRIVHFLVGASLAGGGGYLAWAERGRAFSLFPPDPGASPWMLVAGVAAASAGAVFLVSALAPRPKRAARLTAQAARKREVLAAADAFYAERARAADRDWRSGDLPPPPAPEPAAAQQPLAAAPSPMPPKSPPKPEPPAAAPPPAQAPRLAPATPVQLGAPPQPELVLSTPARTAALKPVATSAPPDDSSPFPSTATLSPIPRAVEEPPPIPAPREPVTALAVSSANDPFSEIRAAIADGRLAEADRLLNVHREKAQGAALAELTALAGDHAAAAGRTSNAKWLWRLALKRFGEVNAMDSPAAQAVSERLRLADS